jgi:hypothetical protein
LQAALLTALDRLFANPASSVENLFYFGFLTERLSYRTGKWLTPLLIGLMYTAHEMSNPELSLHKHFSPLRFFTGNQLVETTG